MNNGVILFILTCIFSVIFIIVSTKGDVKLYRNKKTTQKVVTQISQRMSDKRITNLFLKQNIWEAEFFWCGIFMGIVIGLLL